MYWLLGIMTTAHLATVKDIQEQSTWFIRHKSGCWVWMGTKNEKGYGYLGHLSVKQRAHRWFYEVTHGVIPEGLQIDHLCRNRACVNPQHLEAVTGEVNRMRALPINVSGLCKRGHNRMIRFVKGRPVNDCRICKRATTMAARKGITVHQELLIMEQRDNHLLRHN